MTVDPLLRVLATVAPGTPLREGLDRILQANKGALIVLGDGPEVLNICSGGFLLDAAFSPQRISELAKMDGAIILAPEAGRIARANVHLVPDPRIPTDETGTRHRTAERIARSMDVAVIAVSEGQRVITVYSQDRKHRLRSSGSLLDRANQALQTLGRLRDRLDRQAAELTTLEVEDVVTVTEVIDVLQSVETVDRIGSDIEALIIELGVDGRLVRLQLEELVQDVRNLRALLLSDYSDTDGTTVDQVAKEIEELELDQVTDDLTIAEAARLPHGDGMRSPISPRGHRLLSQIPWASEYARERIISAFGTLSAIIDSSVDAMTAQAGISRSEAEAVKEGIRRVSEASLLRQV